MKSLLTKIVLIAGNSTESAGFASFPSPPESTGFANFADFEESSPPVAVKGLDETLQRQPASPPKSQRRSNSRQSSLRSIDTATAGGGSPEVASLRRQVAELQGQNQQLQATVKSQQASIKQLQVCFTAESLLHEALMELSACIKLPKSETQVCSSFLMMTAFPSVCPGIIAARWDYNKKKHTHAGRQLQSRDPIEKARS